MSTTQTSGRSTVADTVQRLLLQKDGPLTRELIRSPASFGLGQLPTAKAPDAVAEMVCGFCSTGCGLNIHLQQGEAIGLSPSAQYPVNRGMACPKGWESLAVLQASDRATTPLLRNDRGVLTPVDWDTALRTFVSRMQAIQREHGADSVAFISTGQIATEEMALLGSLAKFGMGIVHGDGNTRQCMATSVVAYKQSFGFDAPPYTYADFEESDVIVLVGSNLCVAHPILWERVLRNRHDPQIIVVDPRRTETAMQATHHLPLAAKSDLTLFYGIAQLLIEHDWIDREFIARHTTGFEEFAQFTSQFSIERVAEATRLSEEAISQVACAIGTGKRVSIWWTMGVNQSYEGVRAAQSLINLALMTGNIGRPGTGANSITGQCNAMGSRLFSNTTNLLGGRDFTRQADRQQVAETLSIPVERIPDRPSWAYNEILEGVLNGKIKALWVIATNPAHSWINQSQLRDILSRLDFLVVQDMYHSTETAQCADLLLPAAAWGEKEGTFINSERRIGVIKKVAKAPGQALSDFSIFRLVAHYWGCSELFADWSTPEMVFKLLTKLSVGQPCDFSAIGGYRMLNEQHGIQWPFAKEELAGQVERRLFEDKRFYHPDGRAKFIFESPRGMWEPPTVQYPLVLLTGRASAAQWHTQTRTSKSAVLRKLSTQEIYVEINPADAKRYRIAPNQRVIVESQRGAIEVKAFITHGVKPGEVFIPMHYETTNQLTDAVFDPYSKQPSYKACAVRVRRKQDINPERKKAAAQGDPVTSTSS